MLHLCLTSVTYLSGTYLSLRENSQHLFIFTLICHLLNRSINILNNEGLAKLDFTEFPIGGTKLNCYSKKTILCHFSTIKCSTTSFFLSYRSSCRFTILSTIGLVGYYVSTKVKCNAAFKPLVPFNPVVN